MIAITPNYKASSVYDKERKLLLVARIMYEMYTDGHISCCSPRRCKASDIAEYVRYRRDMGVKDSTICKDISLLKMFMRWLGNNAVEVYQSEYGTTKPVSFEKRMSPIDDRTIERVYALARVTEDWRTMEGCMAVILGTACGLRPQESRTMYVDDVYLLGNRSYVHVTHVKGEGRWGRERNAPIMDGVEDIFEKFLRMRKMKLSEFGIERRAFFSPLRNEHEFLAQQTFGSAKKLVERELGVRFELRAGRRSFGQRALDLGHDLENISAVMGHSSIVTTQRYYASKRVDDAMNAMMDLKNSFLSPR